MLLGFFFHPLGPPPHTWRWKIDCTHMGRVVLCWDYGNASSFRPSAGRGLTKTISAWWFRMEKDFRTPKKEKVALKIMLVFYLPLLPYSSGCFFIGHLPLRVTILGTRGDVTNKYNIYQGKWLTSAHRTTWALVILGQERSDKKEEMLPGGQVGSDQTLHDAYPFKL